MFMETFFQPQNHWIEGREKLYDLCLPGEMHVSTGEDN
jgi:hypothetical protein